MDFNWSQLNPPPADDEIEVTVIGPGFGECILVHTGHGRWLIVDSCKDPESKEPVALLYSNALRIDPAADVDWIVATHWHEDHIGGLSKVVAECGRAQFCCATSLQHREFLVYAARSKSVSGADNARGFRDVIELLNSGNRQIRWIQGGRTLTATRDNTGQADLKIEALSPSDKEVTLFLDRIAMQLSGVIGKPHRALIASDPNLAAIALSVQANSGVVLLGADLVMDSDNTRGWTAAVDQALATGAPKGDLVKIPHHGSKGAHSTRMWNELLISKPVAAVTPYCRGRKNERPPKDSDLSRIAGLSSQTILTAPTESGRARKASSPVALGLSQSGIRMRSLSASIGIARFRRRRGDAWKIETFGRAKKI